jgi:hypothetical protein
MWKCCLIGFFGGGGDPPLARLCLRLLHAPFPGACEASGASRSLEPRAAVPLTSSASRASLPPYELALIRLLT